MEHWVRVREFARMLPYEMEYSIDVKMWMRKINIYFYILAHFLSSFLFPTQSNYIRCILYMALIRSAPLQKVISILENCINSTN